MSREWTNEAPAGAPTALGRLRLCVLGSGSGGNSAVVALDSAVWMIDLGFGPRTITQRLAQAGLSPREVSGVCLTHLDQDHFRPACVDWLLEHGIRLWISRWHVDDLMRLEGAGRLASAGLVEPFDGRGIRMGDTRVAAVRLPHDSKGTVGFVVEGAGGSLGFATDLGHVPEELVERCAAAGGGRGVDILAIESNYDPFLQRTSRRPVFLKNRIMGGHGHLSNEQALAAVVRLVERGRGGRPEKVVLLHPSRQCNGPQIIRRVFNADPRVARRIVLPQQRRCSAWIEVRRPAAMEAGQMELFAEP